MKEPYGRRLPRLRHVEHGRPREPRRTPQQPFAIVPPPHGRLQALAHHAQRIFALELGPPCMQNHHAAISRSLARRREQTRLADPSRSLHQQHRAGARARRCERRLEDRNLLLALHQPSCASVSPTQGVHHDQT